MLTYKWRLSLPKLICGVLAVFSVKSQVFSLFPGCTELDQISKPHDVIGTPTNQTLNKFKQSRAASFDFPFKKGNGIPSLVHNFSPVCNGKI
ncbi:MAPK/MAK/MRK overlapping kinase [Grus japonensis]|uniref:MAPK/MAK/MRK overlapping kinase n=1 Tax=Grus japonensis TaxID=30415 RepID=A0ABC9WZX6_GRUJA